MQQYHDLLQRILDHGVEKTDRTLTGTISIFGPQMRFNLAEGFPLVTTKKVHLKSIIYELLWLLKGDTNIKYLVDNGVNIWNDWPYAAYHKHCQGQAETTLVMSQERFVAAVKNDAAFATRWGDLGPVYGAAWRRWATYLEHPDGSVTKGEPIDQIAEAVRMLKTHPDSRRIIINAWNVADLGKMALTPCHAMFQFYTAPLSTYQRLGYVEKNLPELQEKLIELDLRPSQHDEFLDEHQVPLFRLDCQLYQRSADTMLGVPFNIASYALLTLMMAQVVNMVPGELVWTGGDCHLYSNHLEQARLQLTREPRALPSMNLNPEVKDIFAFKIEDFTLTGYNPHPPIKAPVAV